MKNKFIDIIEQYLDSAGISYVYRDDCDAYEIKTKNSTDKLKETEIMISIDDEYILTYSFLFFSKEIVDKGRFLRLLNKINLNIENAQFIYIANSNGIDCVSSIRSYNTIPSIEMIKDSFCSVKRLMEKFSDTITGVAEGEFLSDSALDELLKGESSDGVVYPIETAKSN